MSVILPVEVTTQLRTFYIVDDPAKPDAIARDIIATTLTLKSYDAVDRIDNADFILGFGLDADKDLGPVAVLTGFDNRDYKSCMAKKKVPGTGLCTIEKTTKLFVGATKLQTNDAGGHAGLKRILQRFPARHLAP